MPQTPIVEVETPDFKIKGKLNGYIDGNDTDANFNINPVNGGGWYGEGFTEYVQGVFHLASPEVFFEGEVEVTLKPNVSVQTLDKWKVGLLQNIYHLERNALYENGVQWSLRQNPQNLPIRDGDEGKPLWYDFSSDGRQKVVPNQILKPSIFDAPNYDMPVKYNGKAGESALDYKEMEDSTFTLQGTSGRDEFKTWLIAAHKTTKSIIILGALNWTINWNGTYDAQTKIWTPAASAMLTLDVENYNGVRYFQNLAQTNAQLPFNPHYASAFENFQVKVDDAWFFCSGKGRVKNKTPSLVRWF